MKKEIRIETNTFVFVPPLGCQDKFNGDDLVSEEVVLGVWDHFFVILGAG